MTAPLRRVTKRRSNRSELLECGHEHPGAYRKAQRRRCEICLETPFDASQIEILAASDSEMEKNEGLVVGPRCSYCLDSRGKMQTCSGCRTLIHGDCRKELRRCPTIGCSGGSSTTLVVAEPRRIVIHRSWSWWRRAFAGMLAAVVWFISLPRKWFPSPNPFEPLERQP